MSDLNSETKNKKGLGRGFASLIGPSATEGMQSTVAAPRPSALLTEIPQTNKGLNTNSAAPVPASVPPELRIWKTAVDKLVPGEFQPRRDFNREHLQELANSIKENGILQPIVGRKLLNGKIEIVAGERRWRAAQLAGLHEVPVILKDYDDRQTLELAIIENVQREDLNPIEEAEGYSRLASEFKMSQQDIAQKVGKDRATVANAIRLLSLPQEIRLMLKSNEISTGHAKVLLSILDSGKQLEAARAVAKQKLSVRKLEQLAKKIENGEADGSEPGLNSTSQIKSDLVRDLTMNIQKALGTRVQIDYSSGKGKITISFYSDEELNNLAEKLM